VRRSESDSESKGVICVMLPKTKQKTKKEDIIRYFEKGGKAAGWSYAYVRERASQGHHASGIRDRLVLDVGPVDQREWEQHVTGGMEVEVAMIMIYSTDIHRHRHKHRQGHGHSLTQR
jgi:hypothetical protein